MASLWTRRFIAVVRPAVRDAVNTRLKHASFDPDGGERTFMVPLRAAGDTANTIVGYWTSCAARPAMLTALRDRLLNAGATEEEAAFIAPGTPVGTVSSQRIFVFDAADWTPETVLAYLNVDRLAEAVP